MPTKQTGPANPLAQHAPVGAGVGQVVAEQAVPAPRHVPPPLMQADSVVTAQLVVPPAGSRRQQAPVAALHGLGLHPVLAPRHTPPAIARQLASVSKTQGVIGAPDAVRQHAPRTAQAVVVQTLFAPSHVPLSVVHSTCVRIRHCAPEVLG